MFPISAGTPIYPGTPKGTGTPKRTGTPRYSPPSYLYYELMKLIEGESNNQLNKLKEDMNVIANENNSAWKQLIKWDIPDKYDKIRQNYIPNGIVPKYNYKQLAEHTDLAPTFNVFSFYSHNQYLSELILLAQSVDNSFQQSVQKVFNIDSLTNIGIVEYEKKENQHTGDGVVEYIRCPVQSMKSAKSKAQNEYRHETYPNSACIVDLNRCVLIFNDISTLLSALKLFTNKIRYYESGDIISIISVKNGFKDYVKRIQFSDIKLNVLIHGRTNNIVGEIQFLLKNMQDFEGKTNGLNAINRQKEYIENSVPSILPMLLNEEKQIFIAGNLGNVESLWDLMVISNKTEQEILRVDNVHHESILLQIANLRKYKAFEFLKNFVDSDLFMARLFTSNRNGTSPMDLMLEKWPLSMLKDTFSMKVIQEKYRNDEDQLFRCLGKLWKGNEAKINYIMNKLNVTKEKFLKLLYHRPEKRRFYAMTGAAGNDVNILKKLALFIGENEFVELLFVPNGWNINSIERGLELNKYEIVKYLLSFNSVKNRYLNDKNQRYRIILWIFMLQREEMHKYLIKVLNITNEEIIQFMNYNYIETENLEQFTKNCWNYSNIGILDRIIWNNHSVNSLKQFISIIGDKLFIHHVLIPNGWNMNSIEYCIRSANIEIIQYIMSFNDIRDKCSNDKQILFRIIYWMNKIHNIQINKFMVNSLKLNKTKLKEIQSYKYPKTIDEQYNKGAVKNLYFILFHFQYHSKFSLLFFNFRRIIGTKQYQMRQS